MTEEEMTKNFLKSTKDLKVQIQEVLTPSKTDHLNTHTHTHTHTHT